MWEFEAIDRGATAPRIPVVPRPGWSQDPPPPTVPDLPPIKSAQPAPESRVLVPVQRPGRVQMPTWVHRSVRRDVAAANRQRSQPKGRAGDATLPPMIIPGDSTIARPLRQLWQRGPRSGATHLIVFAVTTCLVLAFLYAAAPLTMGATNRLGAFIGQANAYELPTPTPTPAPTATPTPPRVYGGGASSSPGTQAIVAEIQSVFGPYAASALAVARCESGYNPNAYNPIPVLGSHAMGVFQILYPVTWQGTSQASRSPYDANANILAAHEIFARDGNSWREWVCGAGL